MAPWTAGIMTSVIIIISLIVIILEIILSKILIEDRENSSPSECGFNPKRSARLYYKIWEETALTKMKVMAS